MNAEFVVDGMAGSGASKTGIHAGGPGSSNTCRELASRSTDEWESRETGVGMPSGKMQGPQGATADEGAEHGVARSPYPMNCVRALAMLGHRPARVGRACAQRAMCDGGMAKLEVFRPLLWPTDLARRCPAPHRRRALSFSLCFLSSSIRPTPSPPEVSPLDLPAGHLDVL